MALTADSLRDPVIDVRLPDVVAHHVAAEVRSALGGSATGPPVDVGLEPELGDGFLVSAGEGAVTVRGGTSRRALDGLYWLLEQLGLAWPEPGASEPLRAAGRSLEDGEYRESPAFPRRTLILGCDGFHEEWRDWMAWASRNRYDDVFFHDTPPSRFRSTRPRRPVTAEGFFSDGGGWMFELWDDEGAAIRTAAAERAMTLQFGGHHLATILPRSLFAEHPDWFPLGDGRRDPRHNMCTSNAAAMARLAEGASAFAARFRGASVYHVWADDVRGGGWCNCQACSGLSPGDQALRATNVIAAAIARAAPGSTVTHLAYRDTLDSPPELDPADNVSLLFAPRERCYAHAIDDETCERNCKSYWEPLQRLVGKFGNRRERVDVFEYYSDAILFKGLAPVHARILPADAAAYAGLAGNLQDLVVSPRPWVGPPLHAWWFARQAWAPGASWDDAIDLFCDAAFPQTWVAMQHYYALQEEGHRLLLERHDLEHTKGRDVLDYADRPKATLAVKANEALAGAAALAARHQQVLKISSATLHERERIARERLQAEFYSAMARHLASRTAAWEAALDGQRITARSQLQAARRALKLLEEWTTANGRPAFAVLAAGMLNAAERHTAEVEALLSG